MLRSATFGIGILLAGLAFVGFLMLGGMMAPPPYSVLVAVQDIPAYSTLDPSLLGVDSQRINAQVARTLILREEIDQYAGGFVLENIHAGEPLRKGALVAPDNPEAVTRLALMMTDPDKVAMVLPLDAKSAPAQIAAGDWVDLVVGLAPGNISAGSNSTFSSLLLAPTPVLPALSFGSPVTGTARPAATVAAPQANSLSSAGATSAGEMNLPADKVVIQNIPVLAVRFAQIPNPAFTGSGAGFGSSQPSEGSAQSPYVQGDLQSVTVVIPRSSVELVTFGIDNGRLHLALLPVKSAQASNGAQTPTFGITFNDVLAWMMRERALAATGQPQASTLQAVPVTPTATATTSAATSATATPFSSSQPTARETRVPVNPPASTPNTPTTIPTGLDLGALLVPLLGGIVLLVLFVAVVRFVRQRRRSSGL